MRLLFVLLACSCSSYAMLNNALPALTDFFVEISLDDDNTQQQPPSNHYCSMCFSIICEEPEKTLKKLEGKVFQEHTSCNNITMHKRVEILNKEKLIKFFLQQASDNDQRESIELQKFPS